MQRGPYREGYDGIQVKITTKRLKSGKCQVKFAVGGMGEDDYYGYMLVEAESTLKEVVREIKGRISRIGDIGTWYQRHLFSIQQGRVSEDGFMIFKKQPLNKNI